MCSQEGNFESSKGVRKMKNITTGRSRSFILLSDSDREEMLQNVLCKRFYREMSSFPMRKLHGGQTVIHFTVILLPEIVMDSNTHSFCHCESILILLCFAYIVINCKKLEFYNIV